MEAWKHKISCHSVALKNWMTSISFITQNFTLFRSSL